LHEGAFRQKAIHFGNKLEQQGTPKTTASLIESFL
jgi:hypothetical protein